MDQNILTTEGEKVERYQDSKVKESIVTKVTVLPIVIGTLSPRMKKAWYGRLSLPDSFGRAQLLAILRTAHILREAAESWLRRPRKRRELKRIIIIIIIIIITVIMLRHWAVSLARYVDRGEGGGGIELRKHASQHLDHRTKEFVRRACVARHQVPRKVGGMAPVSIDDSVNQARQSLESYVQSSHEELLKTVRRERVEKQKKPSGFRARRTEFRMARKP